MILIVQTGTSTQLPDSKKSNPITTNKSHGFPGFQVGELCLVFLVTLCKSLVIWWLIIQKIGNLILRYITFNQYPVMGRP